MMGHTKRTAPLQPPHHHEPVGGKECVVAHKLRGKRSKMSSDPRTMDSADSVARSADTSAMKGPRRRGSCTLGVQRHTHPSTHLNHSLQRSPNKELVDRKLRVAAVHRERRCCRIVTETHANEHRNRGRVNCTSASCGGCALRRRRRALNWLGSKWLLRGQG